MLAGTGDPADLITREGFTARFGLAGTMVLGNGVIIATYRPAAGNEQGEEA